VADFKRMRGAHIIVCDRGHVTAVLHNKTLPDGASLAPECFLEFSVAELTRLMRKSVFCLVPRGDSPNTKRFYSAILNGCIPVIISDWIGLPYQELVDYSSFTVRVKESDVRRRAGAEQLARIAANTTTVHLMQKALLGHVSKFMWPAPKGSQFDPFQHPEVEGLLLTEVTTPRPHAFDMLLAQMKQHACLLYGPAPAFLLQNCAFSRFRTQHLEASLEIIRAEQQAGQEG